MDSRKLRRIFKVSNNEVGAEFDDKLGGTLAIMFHQPEMHEAGHCQTGLVTSAS